MSKSKHPVLSGIGRGLLGCMVLGFGLQRSTAQEIVPLSPQSPGGAAAGESGNSGIWKLTGRIVNDKLSGQIVGLDGEGTGQASPVNISFVQGGKVVACAVSDGSGAFQVPNLAPGTYSALVYGPGGVSAVSVEVLPASAQISPAAEGLPADPTAVLTLDVVPASDVDPLNTAMGVGTGAPAATAAVGTVPSDAPTPAPAGGGGSGGDAGAAALGAAAAAAGIGAGSATGTGGAAGGAGGGGGGAAASPISDAGS